MTKKSKEYKTKPEGRIIYTGRTHEYTTPMSSLLTDESRIKSVDAAFFYIRNKYENPPLKVYIFGVVCFIIGILTGFFVVLI